MKFKKTKIASLAVAGALLFSALPGCALVTTNSTRDLLQVVAEVDISKGEPFTTGEYAAYANAVQKTEILKRELIASYASSGSMYSSIYGWDNERIYETLMNSLVNRQIYLQFARAYFLKNGFDEIGEDGSVTHISYTLDGFNQAVSSATENEKEIAAISYFLNEKERAVAEYNVKVSINNTLDSQEEEVIEGNHTHSHDEESTTTSSRTTPTGVDTVNEDYYDPAYKIYTGSNNASDCGTYEAQEESTPAKRKQAYKNFLASLNVYGLIETGKDGENTSDISSLSYYSLERKSQYETALINKLNDAFEAEAESDITEEWILQEKYENTLNAQKASFSNPDNTALKNALDGVSDTNFVFYAPDAYGYVINILLPFSAEQKQELKDAHADLGDKKGNTFGARAEILKKVTATDQRTAWFEADYAYKAEEADQAFGEGREYLFFENNMKKSIAAESGGEAQYEPLKNYYGKYTFNGAVQEKKDEDGEKKYFFKTNKITIDGFLDEMENYLSFANLTLENKTKTEGYYDRSVEDYYVNGDVNGDVDYSKFVYYTANIAELKDFDANRIFVKGSKENDAMSIINELSFAYNTDTGGLNEYLGYTVSPTTTDFVDEFEYAAQLAVKMGPGSITVAPSEYGWHIMYCTMSYAENSEPYTFDWNQRYEEGSFSNLYYQALKADNFSKFSSDTQTNVINNLNTDACVKIYTERYKDRYSV